jgi:hypothetical protein
MPSDSGAGAASRIAPKEDNDTNGVSETPPLASMRRMEPSTPIAYATPSVARTTAAPEPPAGNGAT